MTLNINKLSRTLSGEMHSDMAAISFRSAIYWWEHVIQIECSASRNGLAALLIISASCS